MPIDEENLYIGKHQELFGKQKVDMSLKKKHINTLVV